MNKGTIDIQSSALKHAKTHFPSIVQYGIYYLNLLTRRKEYEWIRFY
ncbi:MAG: hypothetical protein MUO92_01615 [Dehalococcoidales bacterium]|nr:hypothetical protein [Dehalococcoidales bacterium]